MPITYLKPVIKIREFPAVFLREDLPIPDVGAWPGYTFICRDLSKGLDYAYIYENDKWSETSMRIGTTIRYSKLMLYCPAEGTPNPYPSEARQWREYHGKVAWLFNPFTGQRRLAADVGSDVFGYLIEA